MPVSAPRLGGRGTVTLDASAFESRFNMALVHETVRAELNARRRGTASTKTRGQVRGGGAKPWRQKGTGRARAGSSRSPLWAGGGTVFGPMPRSYVVKVNRKARRRALGSALSEHAARGSVAVFDGAQFSAPSTAEAADLLDTWEAATRSVLVLLDESEEIAGKSFRNIARVSVMPVQDAGVADVIGAASLLVSEAALPALVARTVDRRSSGGGPTAAAGDVTAAAGDVTAAAGDVTAAAGDPTVDAGDPTVAAPESGVSTAEVASTADSESAEEDA